MSTERFSAYAGDKPYAFVSYAHVDTNRIYPIISSLHNDGYRIWYDEGIEITEIYQAEINRQIEKCDVLVFFVSHKSIQSRDAAFEVAYAKARRKPIVMVHIDDVDINNARAEIRGELTINQGILWYKYSRSECEQKLRGSLVNCIDSTDTNDEKDSIARDGDSSILKFGNFEYLIDGNTVTITRYVGNEKTVFVPSEIDGMNVTRIGTRAFSTADYGDYVDGYDFVFSIEKTNASTPYIQCFAGDCIEHAKRSLDLYINSVSHVSLPDSVMFIDDFAFEECCSLVSIKIPDSVVSIGRYAFWGCVNLEYAQIPKSVISIDAGVFAHCLRLQEAVVDPENKHYCTVDGVIFSKDLSRLICCPSGKQGSYDIPHGTQSIEMCAFQGCVKLTAISIPISVSQIEGAAFADCWNVSEIIVPDGITSINEYTFASCRSNIYIPKSVKSIDKTAFIYDNYFIGQYTITTVTAPHKASYYGYEPPKYVCWNVKNRLF